MTSPIPPHTAASLLLALAAAALPGCTQLTARPDPETIRAGDQTVVTVRLLDAGDPVADAPISFELAPPQAGLLSITQTTTLPDGTAATVYRSAPAAADAQVTITARAGGTQSRAFITVKPAVELGAFPADATRPAAKVLIKPSGVRDKWTYDLSVEPAEGEPVVISRILLTFPRQVEVTVDPTWSSAFPVIITGNQRTWTLDHPQPIGPKGGIFGWSNLRIAVRADAPPGGLVRFQIIESGPNARTCQILAPGPQ